MNHPGEFKPCIIEDSDGWQTLSTDRTFESAHVKIDDVVVRTPSQPDRDLSWTVVRRRSAVAVAPMTADGKFVMVEQERVAPRRAFLEFPAGQIDDVANSFEPDVIVAALEAELREEVGYRLGPDAKVIPMGYYFTSQGYSDEHIYLFVVSPVVPDLHGSSPDSNERILGSRLISHQELTNMIASGETCDSLTLALYARLTALGFLS